MARALQKVSGSTDQPERVTPVSPVGRPELVRAANVTAGPEVIRIGGVRSD
jgi:hypothetical protein